MVNEITAPARNQEALTTASERPQEYSEITRAIIAGEAVRLPAERPHLVARRNARWARRNAHA